MTYTMLLNLEKINEWDLSKTTCFVMGVFADLESWAIKYKTNNGENDDFYYLLYRNKILTDLPFLGSKSSISRSIKELEDKGIIKSINKHSNPAYCLTEKGLTWKRNSTSSEPTQKQITPKTKKSTLSLTKKQRFDDAPLEYQKLVYQKANEHCKANNIDTNEVQKCIDWHVSKGNTFVNWLSAFRTWCRNLKKYNPNDGDNTTLGGMSL